MEKQTDIQAAITAGQAMGKPFNVEGVEAVLIPEGSQLKTLEHLQELDHPRRIKRTITTRSADQFVSYFNRYANYDSTVYVDVDDAQFTGEIDHHGELATHNDHKVVYTCPETDEWKRWKRLSNEWLSQELFAEFLQDQHLQIYKPTGAEFQPEEMDVVFDNLPDGARMLEIAKTLQVTSNSSITSGKNMHNGSMKFEYNDDVDGRAGAKGEFEIPTYFVIGVELFKDGKGYLMLCRLKYEKRGSEIKLRYELVRPHKTHERAVRDVIERIRDGKVDTESGELIEGSGIKTEYLYEVV